MSYMRIQIDLAIPMPLSKNSEKLLDEAEKSIKKLKAISQKINEGFANEENTILAQKHICLHEEGKSCPPWEDIK